MSADRARPGRHAERTERMSCYPAWPGSGEWPHFWHLTWENLASAVADRPPGINDCLRPRSPGRSYPTRILLRYQYLTLVIIKYMYDFCQ